MKHWKPKHWHKASKAYRFAGPINVLWKRRGYLRWRAWLRIRDMAPPAKKKLWVWRAWPREFLVARVGTARGASDLWSRKLRMISRLQLFVQQQRHRRLWGRL